MQAHDARGSDGRRTVMDERRPRARQVLYTDEARGWAKDAVGKEPAGDWERETRRVSRDERIVGD